MKKTQAAFENFPLLNELQSERDVLKEENRKLSLQLEQLQRQIFQQTLLSEPEEGMIPDSPKQPSSFPVVNKMKRKREQSHVRYAEKLLSQTLHDESWSMDPGAALSQYDTSKPPHPEPKIQTETVDLDCTYVSHSLLVAYKKKSDLDQTNSLTGIGQKANDSLANIFDITGHEDYESCPQDETSAMGNKCVPKNKDEEGEEQEEGMEKDKHMEETEFIDEEEPAGDPADSAKNTSVACVVVVRKKAERRKLHGHTCKECEIFSSACSVRHYSFRSSLAAVMEQVDVVSEEIKNPWGTVNVAATTCSLTDVMSEQLAKQLHEECNPIITCTNDLDPASLQQDMDTSSDLMLAQMLQLEFDREFDTQLRREEKKFNGESKVSISFENYRMVHPFEDSDSSDDGVDWQDTRHDPYRLEKPTTTPKKGFAGKGKNITTKHDAEVCGRKNTARMDNFGPEVHVGDGISMDLKLSNHVYNALKRHCQTEQRRSARLHEKKEHSTAEQAVDSKTRLLMYKMVNAGFLENVNGCISTGKESVVFHADGGNFEEMIIPKECVLKVFKTTLNEFKNRDKYIKDDYRFKDRFSKLNPRKIIHLWAEKEMHNLTRMKNAGVPCPDVVILKKHILVMSFIGENQVPAPKLKDAMLSFEDLKKAYYQVLEIMQQMFQKCNLVHADLSEYNMLWHDGQVWLIDVSQSVEPGHPHSLEFLFRDCRNVSTFFQKAGVTEAMNMYELFNTVSGLNLSSANEADFLAEIQEMEKMNEEHVQKRSKKACINNCETGPPLINEDD
ncbi:Serine/threonine-protein kinase RIO3 [Bagarius yarrelli]|uniref:Serine/threonine-protein kinase RIO3 n=1 Tax=Bagarius yarrelli TaxID=175774 RepID=A0A556TZ24_BAGYA|nr:Serine/threonine-protein kinase RIO3 [Bagarius yarrelli]